MIYIKKLKNDRYKNRDIHLINGYPAIYTPEKCTVYIHRLIAADILGRDLTPEEVVHHDDGDRSNYSPDNIMIFRTKADHSGYHKCGCALLTDDGTYICDNIAKQIAMNPLDNRSSICPNCGNLKERRADMCKECYNAYLDKHIQGTNKIKPTSDELQELLKTNSKEKIGRMYGVSGKAVAKWVDKYNLK